MKITLWACAIMLPVLLFVGFVSDGMARIALRVARPDIPQADFEWGIYFMLLAIWVIVSGIMIWLTKQGYLGRR